MKIYTIRPQPFGEDAVPKEVRFIVATARASGERVFVIDARPLSPYLWAATRHALSALKKEGRIEFFVPATRLNSEDAGAALLALRAPEIETLPLLTEEGEKDGIIAVSL